MAKKDKKAPSSPKQPTISRGADPNRNLDVYATTFVPAFLTDINQAIPHHHYPVLRRTFDIDYKKYVRSFAGSDFLSARPHDTNPSSLKISAQAHLSLNAANYSDFFADRLAEERDAFENAQNQFDLFKVPVIWRHTLTPLERVLSASIFVPGLAENSPVLMLGDVIHLRPIYMDDKALQPLKFIQSRQLIRGQVQWATLPLPGWNGDLFHGEVVAMNRLTTVIEVNLIIPSGLDFLMHERLNTIYFNLHFPVRDPWNQALSRAIDTTRHLLEKEGPDDTRSDEQKEANPHSWLERMLFPVPAYGSLQTKLNSTRFRFQPVDPDLNYEQLRAIDSIVAQNYGSLPYLISGPPGTGKTKTLVETALQLLVDGVKHMIVCAPSDPAADTLASRLSKRLPLGLMLRLNSPTRTFAEVRDELMPYCHIERNAFGLPPFKTLMQCRVLVTTCRDADILVQACLTNQDLILLEDGLTQILHGKPAVPSTTIHWQALLIDEAAQAIEPETLIPLTVVCVPITHQAPIFVMAGDQQQLGPRTASKTDAIQTSLFSRLLDHPLYSQHPLARHRLGPGKSAIQPLMKVMLPLVRPPFSNLIRNYRSHPAILAVPNALFYYDTLLPEAKDTDSLLGWSAWNGGWPVLFFHHLGTDEIEQDGGGWFNIAEAQIACEHASNVLRSGLIKEEDICVMSPFSAQVRLLRKVFRAAKLYRVNIGPLEAFQGLESRLVIVCTTRSRLRFLEQDKARDFGIIHEPKRFNVAITRARQGLIVLGNPEVLSVDPCWRAFLDFCKRNGLWKCADSATGDAGSDYKFWDEPSDANAPKPVLERVLLNKGVVKKGAALGKSAALDEDMWLVGMDGALPGEEENEKEEEEEEDWDDDDVEQIEEDGGVSIIGPDGRLILPAR